MLKQIFLSLFFLVFTQIAQAKTGFYAGSFDLSSISSFETIKQAIEEKELDELIILVERLAGPLEKYTVSSFERIEKIQKDLQNLECKVQIIAEPWSGKKRFQAKLEKQLEEPLCVLEQLGPSLKQPIATGTLESINQILYFEGFRSFIEEAALIFPALNLMDLSPPRFQPEMSHLNWGEQYIRCVIEAKNLTGDFADHFGKKAESFLFSSVRGKPYAKIAFLQLYPVNLDYKKPEVHLSSYLLRVFNKKEPHSLNAEKYCSDRFPKAFFDQKLFDETAVYFHNGSHEAAIAYHGAEGYTEVYKLQAKAGQTHRDLFIARNPLDLKVRCLVTNLRGKDNFYHVASQFNGIAEMKWVQFVNHAEAAPLFQVCPEFEDFSFLPSDTLIIGFKNGIARQILEDPEWKVTPFSSSGVSIDFCENEKRGKRFISCKKIYGDQMSELLDYFYSKGVRQFQYFGTGASLSEDVHVGDIVIPVSYSTSGGCVVSFENQAEVYLKGADDLKIKRVPLHGWVQSILEETKAFLRNLKAKGIYSLDVESSYYAEFFSQRPDAKAGLLLFISDEPFGRVTLDQFNVMYYFVDEAFQSVLDFSGFLGFL